MYNGKISVLAPLALPLYALKTATLSFKLQICPTSSSKTRPESSSSHRIPLLKAVGERQATYGS